MKIKRLLGLLLSLILILSLPLEILAVSGEKIEYTYTVTKGEVTITGYTSQEYIVHIPEEIEGLSVTAIGDDAFKGNAIVRDVFLPDTAISVGKNAFSDCPSLEFIYIPKGVKKIGEGAFKNTPKLEYAMYEDIAAWCALEFADIYANPLSNEKCYLCYDFKKLNTIVIPEGVTEISDYAFCEGNGIRYLHLPSTLKKIGKDAFYGTYIENVYISDINVWYNIELKDRNSNPICRNLHVNGELLTELTIPETVTEIPDYLFANLFCLEKVTIPHTVTAIGEGAFKNCYSIKEITLSKNVKEIGEDAFSVCSKLSGIWVDEANPVYCSDNGILYNKEKTVILCRPAGMDDKYFSLPSSVKKIGKGAFSYNRLSGVEIPDSVTEIGDEAFYRCNYLSEIILPDSVTVIGNKVFEQSRLDKAVLPKNINKIGDKAFFACYYLTEVEMPINNPIIGDYAFYACNELRHLSLPINLEEIGKYAFYATEINTIYLPDTVKKIGNKAFDHYMYVYYEGSKSAWGKIKIGSDNEKLNGSKIYYNHKHEYAADCDPVCDICGNTRSAKKHTYTTGYRKATLYKNGQTVTYCTKCMVMKERTYIYHPETFELSKLSYTYSGAVRTPSVKVFDSVNKEISSKYYTVKYASGRKKVGKYKITVTFKGKYSGTKELYFTIKPISASKCSVKLSYISYPYNGKTKTPSVTVINPKGTVLKYKTHYTVKYAPGRTNVGKYKVTIKFKGNYSGTKTLYFKINPPKTSVKKLTAGKGSVKVYAAKKSTQISGYKVQYSTSADFSSYKTKTVSGSENNVITLKNLSSKKVYYVRVRTYKIVNGERYYSGWSSYKRIKTK